GPTSVVVRRVIYRLTGIHLSRLAVVHRLIGTACVAVHGIIPWLTGIHLARLTIVHRLTGAPGVVVCGIVRRLLVRGRRVGDRRLTLLVQRLAGASRGVGRSRLNRRHSARDGCNANIVSRRASGNVATCGGLRWRRSELTIFGAIDRATSIGANRRFLT